MILRARIYDPRLGRFIQVDPLAQNFKLYVYNDPINCVDLSGLLRICKSYVEILIAAVSALLSGGDCGNTSKNKNSCLRGCGEENVG